MTPPLSLSMLKMEKNFIAVNEKRYPRKPYEEYSNIDLIGFVKREHLELLVAMEKLERAHVGNRLGMRKSISNHIIEAMWEVADVSNTLDYLFEALIQEYTNLEDEIE